MSGRTVENFASKSCFQLICAIFFALCESRSIKFNLCRQSDARLLCLASFMCHNFGRRGDARVVNLAVDRSSSSPPSASLTTVSCRFSSRELDRRYVGWSSLFSKEKRLSLACFQLNQSALGSFQTKIFNYSWKAGPNYKFHLLNDASPSCWLKIDKTKIFTITLGLSIRWFSFNASFSCQMRSKSCTTNVPTHTIQGLVNLCPVPASVDTAADNWLMFYMCLGSCRQTSSMEDNTKSCLCFRKSIQSSPTQSMLSRHEINLLFT